MPGGTDLGSSGGHRAEVTVCGPKLITSLEIPDRSKV